MLIPSSHLVWTILCLLGTLTLGTLVRVAMFHGLSDEVSRSHFQSLRTWWSLSAALAFALLVGHIGVTLLMATAGFLSLREYLRIVGWGRIGQPTALVVFAIAVLYYALLLLGYDAMLRSSAPVAFVIALGTVRAWLGLVEDYIRITAALVWGLMLFIFCLSFATFLSNSRGFPEPWMGSDGWFLYLVLLTEGNDIAQALIGRQYGKTKIVPRISPKKSLEGLVGGLCVTVVLSVILAPWLTGFMQDRSWNGVVATLLSGVLISLFGFLGDINKSGIKRDVGVKDSGTLLPGQGGMMDRIDSLTFSAPAFYFFVQFIFS